MAKKKAGAISVDQLRTAVEKAVKAERTRGVRVEAPFQFRPGIICGRLIRGQINLEEANALAERITKVAARSTGSSSLAPAVLITKKGTTCGFFPTEQIVFEQ